MIDNNDYLIYKFDQKNIESNYVYRTTLEYNSKSLGANRFIINECLEILDSYERDRNISDDLKIRKKILSVANILEVKINPKQTNASAINKLLRRLINCNFRSKSNNIRIVVDKYNKLNNDSIELMISLFQDDKFENKVEFSDSIGILTLENVLNFKGNSANVSAKITDSVTAQSLIVNAN